MINNKQEAIKLKDTIINSYQRIFIGEDDMIWANIVTKAIENNNKERRTSNIFLKNSYYYPFINSEHPDIYYIENNFIMGIEHFQFDSSKKNRKGSDLEQKRVLLHKRLDKEAQNRTTKNIKLTGIIDSTFTFEYYEQALIETFKSHYSKISEYKQSLRKLDPEKEIKLTFFIEDTTLLGNYIITEHGREIVNPLAIRSFLNLLYETEGLDYIIIRLKKDYLYYTYFFQITKENLNDLYNGCYDLEKCNFVSYKTETISSYHSLTDE